MARPRRRRPGATPMARSRPASRTARPRRCPRPRQPRPWRRRAGPRPGGCGPHACRTAPRRAARGSGGPTWRRRSPAGWWALRQSAAVQRPIGRGMLGRGRARPGGLPPAAGPSPTNRRGTRRSTSPAAIPWTWASSIGSAGRPTSAGSSNSRGSGACPKRVASAVQRSCQAVGVPRGTSRCAPASQVSAHVRGTTRYAS